MAGLKALNRRGVQTIAEQYFSVRREQRQLPLLAKIKQGCGAPNFSNLGTLKFQTLLGVFVRITISRAELNKEFIKELTDRKLLSAVNAKICRISVTPLVAPDSEGVNWTDVTFSASGVDSSDIIPIIQSMRAKFNVDFSKQ